MYSYLFVGHTIHLNKIKTTRLLGAVGIDAGTFYRERYFLVAYYQPMKLLVKLISSQHVYSCQYAIYCMLSCPFTDAYLLTNHV